MDSDLLTDDFVYTEADVEDEEVEEIPRKSQDPFLGRQEKETESGGRLDYGLLIEAIQSYEYLYDLSNKLYKDTKKKSLAWEQISELLNCSVDECMKVWKNLRDRFVKEKNKLASGAEAPETNWPYYEAMLFYSKFTKPRKTHTATHKKNSKPPSRPSSSASIWSTTTYDSIMSPESRPESRSAADVLADPSDNETDPHTSTPVPGPSHALETTTSVSRQPLSSETPTTSLAQSRKRKRVDQENEQINKVMNMASAIVDKMEGIPPIPKNTNSTFCEYLYQELEKMTEEESKKKRREILLLLCKE